MNTALLTTGNEIVTGDTLNTNSQKIANILNSEGLIVKTHMSCNDDLDDILSCINYLEKNHDIIIITGGLGPTSDDRTRFALAEYTKLNLIEFPEATKHISQKLKPNHTQLTKGQQQQALFPKGSVLIPNINGTALGCYLKHKNLHFYLLPGPPSECIPMMNEFVLPNLQLHNKKSNQKTLKWRLFWTSEGQIAENLDLLLANIDCATGYRLETPYLECKVHCHASEIDSVKALVDPFLSPYIITEPEFKASQKLANIITKLEHNIFIEDLATGGILQTLIQSPQNKNKIYFQQPRPQNNKEDLYFKIQGVQDYWIAGSPGKMTDLQLEYFINEKHDIETHSLLYRNNMILHAAAEWLSFRIFELINELHK